MIKKFLLIFSFLSLFFYMYSEDSDLKTNATDKKDIIIEEKLEDKKEKTDENKDNSENKEDTITKATEEKKEKIEKKEKKEEKEKKDNEDKEVKKEELTEKASDESDDSNNFKKTEKEDSYTGATEIIKKEKIDEKEDTISMATEEYDILDLKKENNKEKIIENKKDKEDELTKKEEEKKEIIEIKKEDEKEKGYEKNMQEESSMVLFKEDYDPFLSDIEEKDQDNIKKSEWSQQEDFIPDSIEEFIKANPKYYFDNDDVLKPGNNKINTKLAEKFFYFAYDLFKTNNLKNSRIMFEKLVYYNFRIAESFYYISWCYFFEKKIELAINYMKKALLQGGIENLSKSILSNFSSQIGEYYFLFEDFDKSIKFFIDSIDLNSDNFKIYNKLGISYYKIGKEEEALNIWKKGMEKGDLNCKKNYEWILKYKKK